MSFSEDEKVGELIQHIKQHVFTRRCRARDFFSVFDPLRSGRCTRPQLSRGLSNIGVGLSEQDANLLADYFEEHGAGIERPQTICYVKLCEIVETVFVEGTTDPLHSASSPGSTMMSSFRPNTIEHEDQVMHVLHRLAALCRTRGIVFKYQYQDTTHPASPNPSRQNPKCGGKCTVNQFKRLFPFIKDFSEGELNVIIERYKTKTGDVHFQAVHNDISAISSTDQVPFPRSDLVLRPDDTQWSHHDLTPHEKIKAKAVEKRIRLFEHFQDFDPLRKGYCTVGQVKTVFTLTNLSKEINKSDFDKLAYAHMREDGLFCYADFCGEIDRGFGKPYLEREPLSQIDMPDPSTTAPARRNTANLSTEKTARIYHIEDRIRTWVRERRVLIKPQFQDKDKPNRGFISRNNFARTMDNLGFPLTEVEVGLLAGVFCNLGNFNDFNYVDFCKQVDPAGGDVRLATEQLQGPYQGYTPPPYFDDSGNVISVA